MSDNPQTPKSAAQEEAVKMLKDLFADSAIRRQFTSSVAKTRPKVWRKSSNAPYYKERYALEVKSVLDAMAIDRQAREYHYDDFSFLSKNTLYLRINQALLYLLNEMDFTGEYKRIREQLKITKERTGIRLSFETSPGPTDEGIFMPSKIITMTSTKELKDAIDSFLESEDAAKRELNMTGLMLTEGDKASLEESLVSLDNIAYNITPNSLKIVKL